MRLKSYESNAWKGRIPYFIEWLWWDTCLVVPTLEVQLCCNLILNSRDLLSHPNNNTMYEEVHWNDRIKASRILGRWQLWGLLLYYSDEKVEKINPTHLLSPHRKSFPLHRFDEWRYQQTTCHSLPVSCLLYSSSNNKSDQGGHQLHKPNQLDCLGHASGIGL